MISLSPRLKTVERLINKCDTFADIGCDHAFLSAYLLQSGKCKKTICCDINEMPLKSAEKNMRFLGLADKSDFRLCSGLSGIAELEANEIAIAGMGAELICSILDDCEWKKSKEVHFVFQPMTHPEILRKYLCLNGFEIQKEILVTDSNHTYCVFDAVYTEKITKNELFYYIGKTENFKTPEAQSFFSHLLNYLKNKSKGSADYSIIIGEIEKLL